MSEFQMTHVALVGARIHSFQPLGFNSRSELTMRRALPAPEPVLLQHMDDDELRALFITQLPIWVHNIISDTTFPGRDRMLLSLRRFEGELRDNRENEVIAEVVNAGFRNRQLDPLDLPESMPLRQRCIMLMNVEPWQASYRQLETELVAVLMAEAGAIDTWLATVGPEIDHKAVAV